MLSAEHAILVARNFLCQPGRLSFYNAPSNSDISVKKLSELNEMTVEGYYPTMNGDLRNPIVINRQKVSAWSITFSIKKNSTKLTVQVFCIPEIDYPIAYLINSAKPEEDYTILLSSKYPNQNL